MKNNWIQAPTNPNDLPWEIKAGKRMLWWVKFEAHDKWPERQFIYAGSIKNLQEKYEGFTLVADKLMETGGVYYKNGAIVAYKECDKGPFE